MSHFSLKQRRAGVLLHPTSLPSGQLDDDVERWLDFMAEAGLGIWQVLPLGEPQAGLSPYQCLSAFALNPALLDPAHRPAARIDEPAVQQWFEQQDYWLDDYALFHALKQAHDGAAWWQWPDALRRREPGALTGFAAQHADLLNRLRLEQYQLHRRWQAIRERANARDIHLFGDVPIFVAHDSADVWAHQSLFTLDDRGQPSWVTGVPPDYFSETGQRWGNPHYDWQAMAERNFDWWLARLKHQLALFDLVRIDHFRGLEAVWMIAADCETAVDGHWQKTPGAALLEQLQQELGEVPLVAEDLGLITPEVVALRKRFGLPGMAVLQFAFDAFDDNPHKPKNITPDHVAYTGTHDNDTTAGWFAALDEATQAVVRKTLGIDAQADVVDAMIDTVLASPANQAIIPLQDLLKLGSEARMNVPGTTEGNWQWRFDWSQIPKGLASEVRQRLLTDWRLKENGHAA